MKKIVTVIVIFLFVIIMGIVLIHAKEEETDITKQQTKVGMILNGSVGDRSWGTSHYIGMQKCAEKLNLKVLYRENIPADESCAVTIEELVKEGDRKSVV